MLRSDRPAVRRWAVLCLALFSLAAITLQLSTPTHADATSGLLAPNGQRGIALVSNPGARFGSPASFDSLRKAHDLGVNWVALITSFHTPGSASGVFRVEPSDPTFDEIGQMIAFAHSLGMRVMVQPVVLADNGAWSGSLYPGNLDQWFSHYRDMLGGYTHVAQAMQADEFCIGTEFFALTGPQNSGRWREVIAAVRQVYSGPLTYSANWGDKHNPAYATIDWWDALDYIGISAYFPLSWNNFTTDSLRQGWFSYTDPFGLHAVGATFHWHDAIAAVQARWNKPVQFTRIGFASYANSPGRWDLTADNHLELSVQANAYQATFSAWSDTPWLTGMFWTPWSTDPNAGGPLDTGESPQNKPAAQVLHDWYSGH